MRPRVEANKQRKDMYRIHRIVGKNIRFMRYVKDISQDEVAGALHMSRSRYSALEKGSVLPDFDTVCTLAEYFEVSLDYLLAFDIAEHVSSLLKADARKNDAIHFIEKYKRLSKGAKIQIERRIEDFCEKERACNYFPWKYEHLYDPEEW